MLPQAPSEKAPAWSFAVALASGLALPCVILLPIYPLAKLVPTATAALIFLVLFVVGLPLGFYYAARQLSFHWPAAHWLYWAAGLLLPVLIMICVANNSIGIPGLLSILPVYFGTKAGRRRKLKTQP